MRNYESAVALHATELMSRKPD